jgi:hypothetical protein
MDKRKLFGKILAGILLAMMVIPMGATVLIYLFNK